MNPNFSRPNLAIQWTLSLLNATSFIHASFLDLTKIHSDFFHFCSGGCRAIYRLFVTGR